jgi:signal transduction histidine kinase
LTNLLSNAIKFCPDVDGLITITIADKIDFWEISVMDNGKGINPVDFENIFDKFYQSDNQNIKKPVGSGLGLAICKQIVELHHGKIWAQNNNGAGACFIFTLPK